jgi:hypothetical protein
MVRKYLRIPVLVWFAVLAFPNVSHANIIDWIWSMSGPQMVGVVLHCEYDIQNDKSECRFSDYRFVGKLDARQVRRFWLSIDTGVYTGTGKDSDGHSFRPFKDNMLAFEPMFEIRSYTSRDSKVDWSHGLIGISWDLLKGARYDAFDKFGIKFRPVGVTIHQGEHSWTASYTLRVYPNGFTSDEFGIGPPVVNPNREAEVLHGFTFGFVWPQKP